MARKCKTHIFQDLNCGSHQRMLLSALGSAGCGPLLQQGTAWCIQTPRGGWPSLGKSHFHKAVLMGHSLIHEDTC